MLVLTATEPAADTFCERVIAHKVDALALIAGGLHVSVEINTASLILKVCVEPYPVAARVALAVLVVIVDEVAVKVADVAPAGTLTAVGTVSAAVLLESEKDSETGAAVAGVTVQVAVEALAMSCVPDVAGRAQVIPESGTAGTTVRLAGCATPLEAAVIVTAWLLVTAEVEAVSVAEVAPDGTFTVAGTPTAALLEVIEIAAPPVGAGPESVSVQTLESPPARVAGAHAIEDTVGACTAREAPAEVLLYVAVRVAVTLLATGELITEKEPELAPAGMFIVPGKEALAVLLARLIAIPPVGAGPDKDTLQVLDVPPVTDVGVQISEDTIIGWMVIAALTDAPLKVAVMAATVTLDTCGVAIVNDPEIDPAGTVRIVGIAAKAVFPARVTAAPAAGAGPDNTTVHVLEAPLVTVPGVQATDEITSG